MIYYIDLFFLFLGALFLARLSTAHHPDLIFNKYIKIKSPILQKLFVSGGNPHAANGRSLPKNRHRNRCLILGALSYAVLLAWLIFSIIFLFVGPKTPIEPIEYDDEFFITTLSDAVVFFGTLILCGFEISFGMLNAVRLVFKQNKSFAVFYAITITILFALPITGIIGLIKIII